MFTNLERIGVGDLWGVSDPSDRPPVFPPGTPVGRYLTVERPVRLAELRALYLVNNHSSKWNRRYCWNCGHKYTPNQAQSCEYCQTPLRDLRFLMAARSIDRARFGALQQYARLRLRHRGLLAPVAMLLKAGQTLVVYHYNGESPLVDEASPVAGALLLRWAYRLADALAYLHNKGVVVGELSAANVVIMPDRTVRWFDLSVDRVEPIAAAVYAAPGDPAGRSVRQLGDILSRYVNPRDVALGAVLDKARGGGFARPYDLCDAIAELFGQHAEVELPHASVFSDVGLVRERNEDSWGWVQLDHQSLLGVVADGMGGHLNGQEASRVAVQVVRDAVAAGWVVGRADPAALLERAAIAANQAVLDARRRSGTNMGTTLVMALRVGSRVVVAHVGDSRAYVLRRRRLEQLTQDHSLVGELLAQGRISPEQARSHPLAHTLLGWIGGEDEVDVDVAKLELTRGDRVLLCTDGVTDRVADRLIQARLLADDPRHTVVREVVRDALQRGDHDNATVMLLDIP